MKTILVIQVVCDRVIYFTDDENYKPVEADHVWVVEYDLPLPLGMTTANCWSWRYVNSKLVDASEISPEHREVPQSEQIRQKNLKVLLVLLSKKIDALAEPYLPSNTLSGLLRPAKLDAAQEFLTHGKNDLIEALAKAEGVTALELSHTIMHTAIIARQALEELEIKRTKLRRAILESKTPQELEKIRREIGGLS